METYDHPVKNEYRSRFRRFIRESMSMLSNRKAKRNAIILCLDGPKLLEAQMYVEEGFNPRQIHVVEHNPEIAAAQEKEKMALGLDGIVIHQQELTDFLATTTLQFRIANLDFKSNYCIETDIILRYLIGRQLLQTKAILGTNFLGKRENDFSAVFRVPLKLQRISERYLDMLHKSGEIDADALLDYGTRVESDVDTTESKQLRDIELSRTILSIISAGKSNIYHNPEFIKYVDMCCDEQTRKGLEACLKDGVKVSKFDGKHMIIPRPADYLLTENMFFYNINRVFQYMGHPLAGIAFMLQFSLAYQASMHEAYKYVSSTGDPMLADFYFVDSVVPHLPKSRVQVRYKNNNTLLQLEDSGEFLAQAMLLGKWLSEHSQDAIIKERQFLGSDFVGKKETTVLPVVQYPDGLIDYLRQFPAEDVHELFPEYTAPALAVIKVKEIGVAEPAAGGKISLEQGVSLLMQGWTGTKITQTFISDYTPAQWSAIKSRQITSKESWDKK